MILIKTNMPQKLSKIVINFLPKMLNYLYKYIISEIVVTRKLCDENIIYDWNYEIYVEKLNNSYKISVLEFNKYKPIGRTEYIWYAKDKEILNLYTLYKINSNSLEQNITIEYDYKDSSI